MAQAVDEARRQRELTKQALANDVAKLETRIRAELDWRSRLRRDGPRLAAIAGVAVVLVGTLALLRARMRRKSSHAEGAAPASLDDIASELREIRRQLDKRGGDSAFWQKALLRGLTAVGGAGGAYAAKRMFDHESTTGEGEKTAERAR